MGGAIIRRLYFFIQIKKSRFHLYEKTHRNVIFANEIKARLDNEESNFIGNSRRIGRNERERAGHFVAQDRRGVGAQKFRNRFRFGAGLGQIPFVGLRTRRA
jgi:hypothetical protein